MQLCADVLGNIKIFFPVAITETRVNCLCEDKDIRLIGLINLQIKELLSIFERRHATIAILFVVFCSIRRQRENHRMSFNKLWYIFLILILGVFTSCNDVSIARITQSSDKDITAFSFPQGIGVITEESSTVGSITVTVPFGTAVTGLVATFTTTGASVTINGTAQVSGTTLNDFTAAVIYTVTAEDSSTKTYTITVSVASSDDATLQLSSTIKGVALAALGTPNEELSSPDLVLGSVTITSAQAVDAGSLTTLFTPTNSGATVTKVVKYHSNPTPDFENDPAYADEAITYGDSFVIKITAQDGTTVLYYWIKVNVTYAIGDTGPAGGLIFYVNPTGIEMVGMGSFIKYLEVAPASTEWAAKKWSDPNATLIGTNSDIGTGWRNTSVIVAGISGSETGRAAELCDSLSSAHGGSTYNDWFLPSLNELSALYTAVHLLGGFASGAYWSSSEFNASNVSTVSFVNGSSNFHLKSATYYVRCIRAF